jgi:hypothetical protein
VGSRRGTRLQPEVTAAVTLPGRGTRAKRLRRRGGATGGQRSPRDGTQRGGASGRSQPEGRRGRGLREGAGMRRMVKSGTCLCRRRSPPRSGLSDGASAVGVHCGAAPAAVNARRLPSAQRARGEGNGGRHLSTGLDPETATSRLKEDTHPGRPLSTPRPDVRAPGVPCVSARVGRLTLRPRPLAD